MKGNIPFFEMTGCPIQTKLCLAPFMHINEIKKNLLYNTKSIFKMWQSFSIEKGTYNCYLTHVGIRRYSKGTALFLFEK